MDLPYTNSVFVVGSFRSGTSLLYSVLNQHPQIALMYECDVWDFPEPFARLRLRHGWLERQEFYNQALSRHRLILGARLNGLENVRTPEELYRCYSKGKGASIWGEKSPVYGPRLRSLARRYPGCALILLWRDPVEIYRSIVHAGRNARFFRRPGLLNWLIYCHEQMIQQAAELSRAGIRVHHVTYDEMVDQTDKVCRNLCRFLEIEFYPGMLNLGSADFSAIFSMPHHDHLRRGLIERQRSSGEVLGSPVIRKLLRFRTRWNRLEKSRLGILNDSPGGPEPDWMELLYHKAAGSLVYSGYNLKRALFEFLPLPWLRIYRLLKSWFLAGHRPLPQRASLREQWRANWVTILVSFAVVTSVAVLQYFCDPRMVFIPFYLIPCASITLIINRRWGTFLAVICAVVGPLLQSRADPDFAPPGVIAWNSAMRFVLLQVVILLLDRIRAELLPATTSGGKG